jgi:hypothetical protein
MKICHKLVQTVLGGDWLGQTQHMMTVYYVFPLKKLKFNQVSWWSNQYSN